MASDAGTSAISSAALLLHEFDCDAGTSAWSVDGVQLAFGERPDGRIIHISEAAAGMACDCVCPGCQRQLIARKGAIKEHHFAHRAAVNCAGALETALHKFAKQVLDADRILSLPPVEAAFRERTLIVRPGAVLEFDEAVLEQRLGTLVPDVILRKGDRPLLVEIAVTHRCGAEKIRKIVDLRLSALEIDLSQVPRNADAGTIADAILHTAPRRWLFNPGVEKGEQKLRETEAQKEREAKNLAARKAERLASVYRASATRQERDTASHQTDALVTVRREGYGRFVGLAIPGDACFQGGRRAWQAAIFSHFLISPFHDERHQQTEFMTREALDVVREQRLVVPELGVFIEPDVEAGIRAAGVDFREPYAVVESYLTELCARSVLATVGRRWRPASEHVAERATWRRRKQEQQERTKSIVSAVGRIMARVPDVERNCFDVDTWFNHFRHARGLTFAVAVQENDTAYTDMSWGIQRIESMVCRGGLITDDLMGLPLGPERERQQRDREATAIRLRALREEEQRKKAEGRVDQLEQLARDSLGVAAHEWLSAPVGRDTAMTPRELASGSAEGLHKAVHALRAECHARDAVQRRKQVAEMSQSKLRDAAHRVLPPDHADLFLNAAHPRLKGQRPWAYCINPQTLEDCLALLPGAARRR